MSVVGMRRPTALVLATLLIGSPLTASAQEVADTSAPVIGFRPCETFQKDRPFSVAARFADQSQLFEPKLVYRLVSDKTWKHVMFVRDGELWRAVVPKQELTGALAYFVEVFDENGNGPSRVGSPETPLFARAVKRAPECAPPDVLVAPVVVEEHVPSTDAQAVVAAETKPHGAFARCEASESDQPFYCKRWVWYAAGGALLATVGVVLLATSGGGRDYPDRVDFEIRSQGLEYQ